MGLARKRTPLLDTFLMATQPRALVPAGPDDPADTNGRSPSHQATPASHQATHPAFPSFANTSTRPHIKISTRPLRRFTASSADPRPPRSILKKCNDDSQIGFDGRAERAITFIGVNFEADPAPPPSLKPNIGEVKEAAPGTVLPMDVDVRATQASPPTTRRRGRPPGSKGAGMDESNILHGPRLHQAVTYRGHDTAEDPQDGNVSENMLSPPDTPRRDSVIKLNLSWIADGGAVPLSVSEPDVAAFSLKHKKIGRPSVEPVAHESGKHLPFPALMLDKFHIDGLESITSRRFPRSLKRLAEFETFLGSTEVTTGSVARPARAQVIAVIKLTSLWSWVMCSKQHWNRRNCVTAPGVDLVINQAQSASSLTEIGARLELHGIAFSPSTILVAERLVCRTRTFVDDSKTETRGCSVTVTFVILAGAIDTVVILQSQPHSELATTDQVVSFASRFPAQRKSVSTPGADVACASTTVKRRDIRFKWLTVGTFAELTFSLCSHCCCCSVGDSSPLLLLPPSPSTVQSDKMGDASARTMAPILLGAAAEECARTFFGQHLPAEPPSGTAVLVAGQVLTVSEKAMPGRAYVKALKRSKAKKDANARKSLLLDASADESMTGASEWQKLSFYLMKARADPAHTLNTLYAGDSAISARSHSLTLLIPTV